MVYGFDVWNSVQNITGGPCSLPPIINGKSSMEVAFYGGKNEKLWMINQNFAIYTLWLFNIAMENGPLIDDFPSYKPPFIRDFPWLC